MPAKKQILPGEKVPLKLTATERKLVLEDLMCLDQDHEQVIQDTPAGKPVMLTLDDLDDLGGYIALPGSLERRIRRAVPQAGRETCSQNVQLRFCVAN